MSYPKLPEPIVIEGRRLYTAGQMREYAAECIRRSCNEDEPDEPSEWVIPENSKYPPINGLDDFEKFLSGKIRSL